VLFVTQRSSGEHLFLKCKFGKLVWQVVHFTFNIPPPTNVKNLFGNWLNGIDKATKSRIRVGCVLCYGPFGMVAMILSLIMQILFNFYRLFTSLSIGSIYGHFSFRRTSGCIWILDALA
jgi:hypothetical protein